MLRALFGALFILLLLLTLLTLWLCSVFTHVKIDKKASSPQKVVYRIVKGKEKVIRHEQKIYNKRARSLWGKDMRTWPTFRIYFPSASNYSVFGIIVPDNFQIDDECLKELGFVFGELGYLKDALSIEMPMRSKFGIKLNRFRCRSQFYTISKTIPYLELHDWSKHKQKFLQPTGEFGGLWIPQ